MRSSDIIQSIDVLSIKLRNFDNLLVRSTNEKILRYEVTNITRVPIRRDGRNGVTDSLQGYYDLVAGHQRQAGDG
jgi:hypothetical protein